MNSSNPYQNVLKNSIKYLHDISMEKINLPPVLKSFFGSKYKILEERTKIQVVKSIKQQYTHCPKCCINFADRPPIHKIKSKRKIPLAIRKLIKQKSNGMALDRKEMLNIKKWKNADCNSVVKNCVHCRNEISLPLIKQMGLKSVNLNSNNSSSQNQISATVSKENKKRKKKDKFSGLNRDVIMNIAKIKGNCNEKLLQEVTRPNCESDGNFSSFSDRNIIPIKKPKTKPKAKPVNTPEKINADILNNKDQQTNKCLNKQQRIKLMKEKIKDKKQRNSLNNLLVNNSKPASSSVDSLKMFLSDL